MRLFTDEMAFQGLVLVLFDVPTLGNTTPGPNI